MVGLYMQAAAGCGLMTHLSNAITKLVKDLNLSKANIETL